MASNLESPASTRHSARMGYQDEASYTCPECGEEIVVPVDTSAGRDQKYVEDCPVCCHPNILHLRIDGEYGASIEAESE